MGFKIKIKKPKFPLFTESFQQRQFLQFMQFTNAIVKLFLESLAAAFKALSEMLIFICLFICIYIFNYVICCYAIYFELPSVLEKYFLPVCHGTLSFVNCAKEIEKNIYQ